MSKIVLLIDDDPVFHLIATRMIERIFSEMTIHPMANGKHAIEYLTLNYSTNDHYVIFIDINMPVMNGWQFLEEVKKFDLAKNDNVTIYTVSSSTDQNDKNKALSYDIVAEYLSKPLSIDSLERLLQ